MIIELNKLDHTMLFKEEKKIMLIIIDPADIWVEEKPKSKIKELLTNKQSQKFKMDSKHYLYLCHKVQNYVNYILNNGLCNNFPEIKDDINEYKYEIRVVTQFKPEEWYFKAIDELNKNIKASTEKEIIVTNEVRDDS